jgi:hypothetical protein
MGPQSVRIRRIDQASNGKQRFAENFTINGFPQLTITNKFDWLPCWTFYHFKFNRCFVKTIKNPKLVRLIASFLLPSLVSLKAPLSLRKIDNFFRQSFS